MKASGGKRRLIGLNANEDGWNQVRVNKGGWMQMRVNGGQWKTT